MMALETCHLSKSHDIQGAQTKLEGLKLSEYPGKNVIDFATEALRLLNVMGRALCSSSSNWFEDSQESICDSMSIFQSKSSCS